MPTLSACSRLLGKACRRDEVLQVCESKVEIVEDLVKGRVLVLSMEGRGRPWVAPCSMLEVLLSFAMTARRECRARASMGWRYEESVIGRDVGDLVENVVAVLNWGMRVCG